MSKNKISAKEFDRLFDEGREDITKYLDLKAARRPGLDSLINNEISLSAESMPEEEIEKPRPF